MRLLSRLELISHRLTRAASSCYRLAATLVWHVLGTLSMALPLPWSLAMIPGCERPHASNARRFCHALSHALSLSPMLSPLLSLTHTCSLSLSHALSLSLALSLSISLPVASLPEPLPLSYSLGSERLPETNLRPCAYTARAQTCFTSDCF